jgi:hypothetical protein
MQYELTLYALRHGGSAWLAREQYAGYGAVVEELLRETFTDAGARCALPFPSLARFIVGGLDGLILQFISDRDSVRARRDLETLIAAVIALAGAARRWARKRRLARKRNAPDRPLPRSLDELAEEAMVRQHEDAGHDSQGAAAKIIAAPAYAQYKSAFAGRRMPFAYVDLDLLDANVREAVARAAGKCVRVASKSVRSVAMLRRILDSSPSIQGLMCFTAPEAVWLAAQGFDDLLIGYPCFHEQDIADVARATAGGAHITLMVDSIAHVERTEAIAQTPAGTCRLP